MLNVEEAFNYEIRNGEQIEGKVIHFESVMFRFPHGVRDFQC
jgi:hypothetical protein